MMFVVFSILKLLKSELNASDKLLGLPKYNFLWF